MLIRRPEDDQWYDPNGPEGIRMMTELQDKCPQNKRLSPVTPIPK